MTSSSKHKDNCKLKWHLTKTREPVRKQLGIVVLEEAADCLLLLSLASFKWLKQGKLLNCILVNLFICVMWKLWMCDYLAFLSSLIYIVYCLFGQLMSFVLFILGNKWVTCFHVRFATPSLVWIGVYITVCVCLFLLYV